MNRKALRTRIQSKRSPVNVVAVGQPSGRLLSAALSGLLGFGAVACGNDDAAGEPDPILNDAGTDVGTAAPDAAAAIVVQPDAAAPDAVAAADTRPVVTKEIEGTRTFASLTTQCDELGGYVQIHAACSGSNTCQGFSYGDWDPGVLSEHTCAGINGCNGLSCVVPPADSGKTGQQVYEEKLPETGPRACANCHAEWDANGPDLSKFHVWVLPGSGRTLTNWLDRTAAEQERMVAFGSSGRLPNGVAFSHMASYSKLFSRAEIGRVVQYIRTKTTPELSK